MNKITPTMTNIDLEANRKIEEKTVDMCLKTCIFITLIICCSPFITADLYFAYNADPCQFIENDSIYFTLNTWLKVNGFFNLSMISVIIICFMCVNDKEHFEFVLGMMKIIFGCGFAWTIVGSVLFWKYADGHCDKSFNDYMYARLILGLISVSGIFKKEDKQ
jgi:hypothetical protein